MAQTTKKIYTIIEAQVTHDDNADSQEFIKQRLKHIINQSATDLQGSNKWGYYKLSVKPVTTEDMRTEQVEFSDL